MTDLSPKEQAILAAALTLFCRQGFEATNVPQIARQAGVSVGTIYHYFTSKEALVNVLYRRHKAGFRQFLIDDFPFDAPLTEQFHEYFQRQMRYALTHREAFTFIELYFHTPYLDEQSRAEEAGLRQVLLDAYRRGIADGLLKPIPAEILSALVFGAVVALVKASQQNRLELTPAVIAQAEACCLDAILQSR